MSTQFTLAVDGSPMAEEVAQELLMGLVEDNLNVPGMFVLSFRDPGRTVLQKASVRIGSAMTISVSGTDSTASKPLMEGEVTALEAEYDAGGSRTLIRGFDHAHRLFRGRMTEAYLDCTASDIATKVARRAGLELGQIDSTTTVYKHTSQANVDDWHFLKWLAQEIGFDIAVMGGKFEFRARDGASAGPSAGSLTDENPLQLRWGDDLIRIRSIVTAAEQVKEVEVRGWDPSQKKAVVGKAPAQTTVAQLSISPADLARLFGDRTFVAARVPYQAQADVDGAAKTIAEQLAGGFAELEGVARGNVSLRAGTAVALAGCGDPFDGKYLLSSTRHVYQPHDGYSTWFTVSGHQDRSVLGLAANGRSGRNGAAPADLVPGVVVAEVTDVNDPDELGRVKLKLPWLSDSYVSDWSRVVQAGAGSNRGTCILPEVGDEVLVCFEQGDIRRPFVLGGLHNGTDKPNLGSGLIDGSSGAVKRRGFVSKKGGALVFLDDDSKEGVALMSGDHGLRVALDKTNTRIKITSNGDVHIEGARKFVMKGGQDVSIEAGTSLTLKGASVSVKADGALDLEGANAKLKGSATAEVDGGGMANIHAGMVKIN